MRDARRLIVNADDFGQTPGINDGIARAFEAGILTSASLMVRQPHAEAAAAYARAHPALSVGLHIDLGEWAYRDGAWTMRYQVIANENADDVRRELERQLDRFLRLLGREPTHLDSHQHVHLSPPLSLLVSEHGQRLGVPVRSQGNAVKYEGGFYGQSMKGFPFPNGVSTSRLIEILRALPPGATELGCHPGLGRDAGGMYIAERELEVETLCDPTVRQAVRDEHIELVSFHDVQVTSPWM